MGCHKSDIKNFLMRFTLVMALAGLAIGIPALIIAINARDKVITLSVAKNYTTAGDFTVAVPSGANAVRIRMSGGGGGGSGGTTTTGATHPSGGGGGSGAYIHDYVLHIDSGVTTIPITVGAGGAGGLVDAAGANGGNSAVTVGPFVVKAYGGTGSLLGDGAQPSHYGAGAGSNAVGVDETGGSGTTPANGGITGAAGSSTASTAGLLAPFVISGGAGGQGYGTVTAATNGAPWANGGSIGGLGGGVAGGGGGAAGVGGDGGAGATSLLAPTAGQGFGAGGGGGLNGGTAKSTGGAGYKGFVELVFLF
jgi:hypothetical protein